MTETVQAARHGSMPGFSRGGALCLQENTGESAVHNSIRITARMDHPKLNSTKTNRDYMDHIIAI